MTACHGGGPLASLPPVRVARRRGRVDLPCVRPGEAVDHLDLGHRDRPDDLEPHVGGNGAASQRLDLANEAIAEDLCIYRTKGLPSRLTEGPFPRFSEFRCAGGLLAIGGRDDTEWYEC